VFWEVKDFGLMRKKWKIKDLIDLEYFLHDDDDGSDTAEVPHPDRRIYLEKIKPVLEKRRAGEKENKKRSLLRRDIFRFWLDYQRDMAKASMGQDAVLPGEVFEEVYTALLYTFLAIGFLSGAGLAFSLLTYHGAKPLNVSLYLGVFVIGQLLLVAVLFIVCFFRRTIKILPEISILYRLFGLMLTRAVFGFREKALKHFPAGKRKNLQSAFGLAEGGKAVYGSIFYWPLFILAQTAGVGFNLGVLAATMLRVAGRDLAFGWESTIQLSSTTVHEIVRGIAVPWAWIFQPGVAYPTIEQIEGSKIILKEGIYHLATRDLVSWWPFLCLAVLFYGLLPRVVLLAAGLMARARALSRPGFYHSSCEKLMIRMTTPALRTKGFANGNNRKDLLGESSGGSINPSPIEGKGEEGRGAVILVPDDIFEQSPALELSDRIRQSFGYALLKRIKIGIDTEADSASIKALTGIIGETGAPAVLLLQEAWQPPIKETRIFIQEVRSLLGQQSQVIIALIGKPNADTIFTKVEDENWKIWKQEITGMGDPGIWTAKFGNE